MRPSIVVTAILPSLAGACAQYAEHRAALVPHPTPMPWDGQPLDSRGAVTLGATNLFDPITPTAGTGDPGLQIPNTQMHGDLGLRLPSGAILGFVLESGLPGGISVAYSFGKGPLRLGVATEVLDWQVPWVQYSTCVQDCEYAGVSTGYTVDNRGTDSVPMVVLALTPSYRDGRVTWFGGLTLANHPNLDEKVIDYGGDPSVQAGPINAIASFGASFELGAGVRASVIVHQDFIANPVRYGPSFAALMTLPLGRDTKPFVSVYDRP